MTKFIGFILILLVVPLGLVAAVLLVASVKPHAAVSPCIDHETKPVVLYQGTYFDVVYPWGEHCVVRYNSR